MTRGFVILLCGCFTYLSVCAQNLEDDIALIIQDRLAFVAENNAESTDLSSLAEIYWQFAEHPIIINTNSLNDIASLQLLSPLAITNLARHLYTYGNLLSIYELQAIEGMTLDDIARIQPFVVCKVQSNSFDITDPKQELLYRISSTNQATFFAKKDRSFYGSPYKQYLRYRLQTQSLQIGINAENDAGESFLKSPNQYGFDHYGGFVSVKNIGILKQATIGDFQANFGQGLVLWTGFGFGKSTYTQQVVKIENRIRPYSSSLESNFLRGAAATLQFDKWQITPILVYRNAEANITDTLNGEPLLNSIESIGMHRNENELTRKNATMLFGTGLNTNYQFKKLRLGLSYFQYNYHGVQQPTTDLDDYWSNNDLSSSTTIGTDFIYSTNNGVLFGETALNEQLQLASVFGTTQAIGKYLNTSIVYRYYPAGNNPRYKLGFADGNTTNESGIYWGNELQLSKRIQLSGYIDLYQNNWISSRYYLEHGKDLMLKIQCAKKKNYTAYVMLRKETTDQATSISELPSTIILPETSQRIRLHLTKHLSDKLVYETRIEFSKYTTNNTRSSGWLTYQSLQFRHNKWSLSLRYTKYNTDNFDTRIYAYEHDVLYAFKVPAYYQIGNSYYLLIKKKLNKGLSMWLRFGNNRTYPNLGLDEQQTITNNSYATTMQMQWKF
jgi:hypothetical protein